jgi:hypothetical protein
MSRNHIVLSIGDRLKRILVILSEGDSEENQQHLFLKTRLQVIGYHGGRIDHKTRRMLFHSLLLYFYFGSCFKKVTSNSSEKELL